MTTPEHIRIVWRGTIVGTPEIWSLSFKYKSNFGGGLDDLNVTDIHPDGMLSAANAFFHTSHFTTSLQVEEWRAYKIKADGLTLGNPHLELLDTADFVHGTAGIWHPPQVAVVVTTVGANRGPARYGRFYLPQVAHGPSAVDQRLSLQDATNLAEASSTFVKNMSSACDVPNNPMNSPLINVSTTGTGTIQEVDHIQVGRVFDTQRRRRNALLEEPYSTGHIDW